MKQAIFIVKIRKLNLGEGNFFSWMDLNPSLAGPTTCIHPDWLLPLQRGTNSGVLIRRYKEGKEKLKNRIIYKVAKLKFAVCQTTFKAQG